MKKCLLISANDLSVSSTGGQLFSRQLFEMLDKIYDLSVIYLSQKSDYNKDKNKTYIVSRTKNRLSSFIHNIFNYAGYLTIDAERKIIHIVSNNNFPIVVIDSSNLGRIAQRIKTEFPQINVIVYFQNIEYYYVTYIIKHTNRLYNIQKKAVKYNETNAVRYADYIICLNKRDTQQMEQLYHRSSDLILPISLKDRFNLERSQVFDNLFPNDLLLFVGSLFYANYFGIKWFIFNVMPYIKRKLIVIGTGFESKKKELNRDNVEIIGTVDDLDTYYYAANNIVLPIFEGSGMKVKTTEALMFGKNIFGTTEAFEGYEVDYNKVGGLCNTQEEFIKSIESCNSCTFNYYSRSTFESKYSFDSSFVKLRSFLESKCLL